MSRDWASAYQRGDELWYERNLAADAITILPNGAVRSRAESVAALQKRTTPVESLQISEADSTVRVAGDMAVETGIEILQTRDAQNQIVEQRFRYTVVYVRADCRWRAFINQATPVTVGPAR